jgi:hypothetical protein
VNVCVVTHFIFETVDDIFLLVSVLRVVREI